MLDTPSLPSGGKVVLTPPTGGNTNILLTHFHIGCGHHHHNAKDSGHGQQHAGRWSNTDGGKGMWYGEGGERAGL